MPDELTVMVNVRTTTPGNSKRHWRHEWREKKAAREQVFLVLKMRQAKAPLFPVWVRFTRLSRGTSKMDRHNIPGALKAVIDGLADFYGVDDGDERDVFDFDQRTRQPQNGVLLEIASLPPPPGTVAQPPAPRAPVAPKARGQSAARPRRRVKARKGWRPFRRG